MHGYIDRQKSPLITRRCDPYFNSAGISDCDGNLVEIQVNTVTGLWAAVVKDNGKPDVVVAQGYFPNFKGNIV